MTTFAGSYDVDVTTRAGDAAAWDAFLAGVPRVAFQQAGRWAEVKAAQGWRSARMTITRAGAVVGGAQLLYRSIPVAGAVGLVARGPVLSSDDPDLVAAAAEGLDRLAAACDVTYLIVQPPWDGAAAVAPRLLRHGYRTAPEVLAPYNTTTGVLDLGLGPEATLAGMRSSTRRNVRLAQRRRAVVREGTASDLPIFHSLLASTARRRGFTPSPPAFFEAAWDVMAPAGMLRMAVTEVGGEPVSAFLWVVFGDGMNCWRGGWSGEHRHERPNEALDWAGMCWAAEHGLRWYDFQATGDYVHGFGGARVTSPGPLERVTNPLLRRVYPQALHRMLGSRGVARWTQSIRRSGWPGSLRATEYAALLSVVSAVSGSV